MTDTRLLFVIPPYFDIDDHIGSTRASPLPPFTIPYGVLSLEANVKHSYRSGVEISILDLNLPLRAAVEAGDAMDCLALFENLLRRRVQEFKPDIVGLSALFSTSHRYLQDLALTVKQARGDATVVAGGGLPSAGFRQVLDSCPSIDAICRGEGEVPLAELIDSDDRPRLLDTHPSWMTRTGLGRGKTSNIPSSKISTRSRCSILASSILTITTRGPSTSATPVNPKGRYDTAIRYFRNVVDKYPDHAFGHYFLARAYEDHGNNEAAAKRARDRFDAIVDNDPWWRSHALRYGLVPPEAAPDRKAA